jgi:signal transduction histidine kinase
MIITYAIVKHQLMDIRVVITRTGMLLAIYLVVLGMPFLVGWFGRQWLEERLGQGWWLVPLSLCTALATAGPFAYAYLRRQAEGKLLSEQRRYQRTLQLAARGMTQVRNVTKLSNLITRLVSRTVGVTHASLFLWDQPHQRYVLRTSHGPKRLWPQSRYGLESSHPLTCWLREHQRVLAVEDLALDTERAIGQELANLGAVLAIPGLIAHQLVGFLVLGGKLSGEGYSADDLHAFATLANEAAMAIENAMSYEEVLKVNEQLKLATERLLIQERLAAAGQFATGMAHEIKNPLSAIKTFAQYLPEKHTDPAFREKFFRIVQEEIDRINTLVRELSDFAKPAPLQLQPIHLSSLVEDTLSLLSSQCLRQGVEVVKSFQENGLVVQADPQQLKQVILNLLLNSLEAMSQGGRLEVATQAHPTSLALRIADTGCGISPEHQREVWDPFFTTKERGMGLGLAIVKGVVERHGGQITLSSQPGKGTVVELSLPVSPS